MCIFINFHKLFENIFTNMEFSGRTYTFSEQYCAVISLLSCPGLLIPSVLSRLTYQANLSRLTYLTVLTKISCSDCAVMIVLSRLSHISWMPCPSCPVLAVSSDSLS